MNSSARIVRRLAAPVLVLLIAVLGMAPCGAAAAGADAAPWIERYQRLLDTAPGDCAPVHLPAIPAAALTGAFPLPELIGAHLPEAPVIYSRDPIAERLIVLAVDADGCVHVGASGRALPFADRGIESPLPNTLLPAHLGLTPPVAIVADRKSVRPWVETTSESRFREHASRGWAALGAYTGMLGVLLLVGIGFTIWTRSRLALAYVLYICALQFYQLQAFGLGFAWLPFWPGPEHTGLMHALAASAVVTGIAGVVVAFLRPSGLLRAVIIAGVALSALAYILSAWDPPAYRIGAATLAVLAVLVLIHLARRLHDEARWMRWFTAGLGASMLGGGVQTVSVLDAGAALPGSASEAFMIGTLVESLCWMIAMATYFRADRLSLQRTLRQEPNYDPLTRVFSRPHLIRCLQQALSQAKIRPGHRFGLVLLDLDDFDHINARLGYRLGDELLAAVGRALVELGLPSQAVGRFGGDEFLILIQPGRPISLARGAATMVIARFDEPFQVGGQSVLLRASVAVVDVTGAYEDTDTIIRAAYVALDQAKRAGGGRFAPLEQRPQSPVRGYTRIRRELIGALEDDQLLLHYQPLFSLETGLAVDFEALLRWRHPERGLLCAAEFLPDAAHCGLLRRFSARALDLALRQVAQWQRAGVWQHGERLSVNLPNRYLTEDSLPELLAELLRQHPLEPGTLSLDVHESALTDPGGPIHRVLKRLLDLDLLVAVDDFGSSQCALPMLAELRPYLLKLDAGVVEGINSLETSQNLARMALRIGEEIGSMVSAEGIERPEQLATLEVLGYRYGQGQLLTAPMPAEQVPIWLDKWQPTPFLSGETEQVPRIVH